VTSIEICDAGLGDMARLRAVYRRSSLSNPAYREALLAHPEVLELTDQAVREGRTRTARAGGRIIGFASWLDAGDTAEIEDMFVDPEWMGLGVGLALVRDLITLARGRQVRLVRVTANPDAVGFYEKAGFAPGGEVATTFGPAPRLCLDLS
jgi:GNAT superfamily N-acetyltransferase